MTILSDYIEEIKQSSLNASVKDDALKALSCCFYIQKLIEMRAPKAKGVNERNFLEWAINNRNKNTRIIYENDRDFDMKVMRTPDRYHTSFHIGEEYYKNGEQGAESLKAMIAQMEDVIKNLTPEGKFLFANYFEFDQNTGCIERRLAGALNWAVDHFSKIHDINYIIRDCKFLINVTNETSLLAFMKQYIKKHKLMQCYKDGKLVNLTDGFLKYYLKDVLLIDDEVEDSTQEKDEKNQVKYLEFFKQAIIRRGGK